MQVDQTITCYMEILKCDARFKRPQQIHWNKYKMYIN